MVVVLDVLVADVDVGVEVDADVVVVVEVDDAQLPHATGHSTRSALSAHAAGVSDANPKSL